MRFVIGTLLCVVLISGCRPSRPEAQGARNGRKEIVSHMRGALSGTAESGEGGSGMDSIFDGHKQLKDEDPALHDKLQPTIQKLQNANGSSDRKKHAKELLEMLPKE